jgi:transcriptional regulator with AAA-type ATPase domain/tetratricopeptide (TPR) repeat protein
MDELAELLGESPTIEVVRGKLRRLLDRQRVGQRLPAILIQGDTGTGKGLVARLLHRHGARRTGPFVDVNCAAIPETLLEAELFGFERGAFTDARHAKPGLFQAAHGGVLFLDEVALLPDAVQAKLLTAVEERTVRRLGGTRPEPADAWLISATNADLPTAVRARRFREDLYHRLAVLTIALPPLRERGQDILLLAERFLARACAEYGLPPKRLDPGALARLLAYAWPGNIRELANVIERAVLFADTPVLTADSLGPLEAEAAVTVTPEAPARTAASRNEAMRQHLLRVLEQTAWNISLTAAHLGIARNTVYARLEKFGLRPAPVRQGASGLPSPVEGAAKPPAPDTRLQWEQRSLTLLRADLRDTDRLDAWSQASRALDAILAKVHSFGGRVEEVTPRSLVAAFGLEPTEDVPRRAALAAIAIQKQAERARESNGGGSGVAIGLHVAPLLIGRVGPRIEIDAEAKRAEWPMLDQLLQARAAGETVASAAAATFLERRFELMRVDTGNGDVQVYRLTGQERRGLGLWGAMTRFVGRREELELLRSRLSLAQGGHGQVAAILGDAGVGKSRLIYEFAPAQRLDGWRVLETTAVSYGQAMSYLPVIALLKSYFAIQDQDDPSEVNEKITGKLLTLDAALQPTLPALLALLDVPVENSAWRALDPPQRRQRTLDAIKRLLLRESQVQPLLVVFEDLHWIDGETQALLDSLVESLGSARLLLLVTYRPEYEHRWGRKTTYSQLRLDSLPAESAAELLANLLGPDSGLAELTQMLVKRGNPFFLEETVRTLVETGALAGERGAYRLTRPLEALQVPATVQAILAARIDRLPAEEKQLLQAASVIGKDVPYAILAAIAEQPEEDLRRGLGHLQAAEFLYETQLFPDLEFTFKHALTHDVTYVGLLQERRRALHARVVQAIETLHRDRLGEQIERLAHHAVRGELREQAVRYLRQAGLKAAGRSAPADARARFEQALEVLVSLPESPPTLEQAFDIRLELRPTLIKLGEVARALERLREADALAERLNDDRRRGLACASMTGIHTLLGDLDEALVTGTRALEIAGRFGDIRLRISTAGSLEQAHYCRGEHERVVQLATDDLGMLPADWVYESFGSNQPASVFARGYLMLSLAELGRFSDATEPEAEAIRIAARTQHAFTVGWTLNYAGTVHLLRGDWAQARSLLDHAAVVIRAGNAVVLLPRSVVSSAWVLAQLGEASEGLSRLREGEQLLERQAATGHVGFLGSYYQVLGRTALVLGRLDDAQRLGDRAVESSPRQPGFAAHALHLLGDIATHPDRFDAERGETHYRQALALAEPRGMRPLVAHCHLGLAKLFARTGKREQAREYLTTATTMYREMDMPFWLEQAQVEMKRLAW